MMRRLDKNELVQFILEHLTDIVECNIDSYENGYENNYVDLSLRVRIPDFFDFFKIHLSDCKKQYMKDNWKNKSDSLHNKIAGMIEMSDDPEGVKKATESAVAETKDFFYKMLGIEE